MVGERWQKSVIVLSWERWFVGRALLLLLSVQAAAGGEICAGVGRGGTASTNGRRTITLQVLATTCVTSQRRGSFTRAHDGSFSVCASTMCCMWRVLKQHFVQRRMLLAVLTGLDPHFKHGHISSTLRLISTSSVAYKVPKNVQLLSIIQTRAVLASLYGSVILTNVKVWILLNFLSDIITA